MRRATISGATLALLLLLPLVGGCPGPTKWGGIPSIGEHDSLRCQKTDDCRVACTNEGSCCGQGCTCSNLYSEAFYQRLLKHQRRHCSKGGYECPHYKCAYPTYRYEARCVRQRCTRVKVPYDPRR